MVYRTCLENKSAARHREFESHPLRMKMYTGIVQRGARRGTALGFPTANIPLDDPEPSGIYAARVTVKEGEAPYMAAVFADQKRKLFEAHILDFSDDLYGEHITIELHKKVRDAETFENDDKLRAMITEDIKKAREYFKNV